MDKKQSVKNAILSVVSKHSTQSNLFLAADCKPKQLQNAVSSFAHGCEAEDIVVLIDESFMNSGKKGYLFSTEGLYADDSQLKHKNPLKAGGIPMPLRYEELDDVGKVMYVHSNQNDSFSLRYKSGERISVVSKYAQLLSEILRAVLQELRREEAVADSHSETGPEDTMDAPRTPPEAKQPETASAAPAKRSVQEMLDLGAACGKQKDFEGAIRWYEAVLESGELREEAIPTVQNMCGMLCCVEDNPNPQMEKALSWFEKAAKGGHAGAQYQCGAMYINGQGTRQDLKKALEYLEMAAAQGHKEAKAIVPQIKVALTPAPKAEAPKPIVQEDLAPDEAYAQGMERYRAQKYAEAFPYLKKICSLGKKEWKEEFLDARIALGWMYENGQGTEVNMDSARSQYQRGGNAGSAPCREAFVRLTASEGKSTDNWAILKRRITIALEWARELVVSGSQSVAEYIPVLERLYEETQQTKKMAEQKKRLEEAFQAGMAADKKQDYTEALRQFKIAADLGNSAAMFNLGIMYSNGEGTAVDKAEALRWYLKAAERGHTRAQFKCGVMYDNGEGTTMDKAEALRWYLKAAEQGDAPAQFNCGLMYSNGEGTAVDYTEAFHWYLKSAQQGNYSSMNGIVNLYWQSKGTVVDKEQALCWCLKAAERGEHIVQMMCGLLYLENNNKSEALRWYLKSAEQGNAIAQSKCGIMYEIGEGTAVDKAAALHWYLKAAEQGDADAQFNCGHMYSKGEGTAVDNVEALRWFLKAAEQGNVKAQFYCGVMYDDGKGTAVDKAAALRWYLKAAEQGHASAQFYCGVMYSDGKGTAVDKAAAMRWYLKAAEQGHALAQFTCGVMYDAGEGTAVDKAAALRWFLKAAEQGDADAQFNCGFMYYKGEGTSVDKAEALRWYLKAAEQGIVNAQLGCGFMYYFGESTAVAVDKVEALRWFLKAAEQGNASAQFYCGVMYSHGEGTAVDKAEALRWFLKAAEQGEAKAQFNCGVMYYNGEGTAVDKGKSKMWFQKAAAQGNEDAIKALRERF